MTTESGTGRTYRITTLSGFTGHSCGVAFTAGAGTLTVPSEPADHPDARRLSYFRGAGYGVEDVGEDEPTPALTRTRKAPATKDDTKESTK